MLINGRADGTGRGLNAAMPRSAPDGRRACKARVDAGLDFVDRHATADRPHAMSPVAVVS